MFSMFSLTAYQAPVEPLVVRASVPGLQHKFSEWSYAVLYIKKKLVKVDECQICCIINMSPLILCYE